MMINIARVRLAMPLSVPNAIPIFLCRVGVTKKCSAVRMPIKSATPEMIHTE